MEHVILVLERALDEKKLAARGHQSIAVVEIRRTDDIGDEDQYPATRSGQTLSRRRDAVLARQRRRGEYAKQLGGIDRASS
jgi:hypothetical protein